MKTLLLAASVACCSIASSAQTPVVLHAARVLDVEHGTVLSSGEVLVQGGRIVEVGEHVSRPPNATIKDLGDVTLMPGLIDVHTHLFLHPGNEAMQTVNESVPARTLMAAAAAKNDLEAGFTAERDMGTEGAGCADVAVRDAINRGEIPGPRMRVSCNAIDLSGGHEDLNGKNPEEHLLSNADRADSEEEIVRTIRMQRKQGSDFVKMYETGRDQVQDNELHTPYQYTETQLHAAVEEAHRTGTTVAVHATGEPGTGFAAAAGVASIDHAYALSAATMKLMHDRMIYAVPTFAIGKYFAEHAETAELKARREAQERLHIDEFKKQMAAGVPFAVGSDVGPFPHGTQAHEMTLMAQYGMKPADVLRADLLNGAALLGWKNDVGQLKPGFYADIVAVPGNPLDDISVLENVRYVMKGGKEISLPPQR